jgi:hypothetical protein
MKKDEKQGTFPSDFLMDYIDYQAAIKNVQSKKNNFSIIK